MATDFKYRKAQVGTLTSEIGVYVLADLENVPMYVGQSRDGIRQRVQRHLTSARSDIIANRQIDVWEIGFVWAFPCASKEALNDVEAVLFHQFHGVKALMNGKVPAMPMGAGVVLTPSQVVQVIPDSELRDKLSMEQRLPRQAAHYASLVDHYLAVKNSSEIAHAMDAHFERLQAYHRVMVEGAGE